MLNKLSEGNLLNENGQLIEVGNAFSMVKKYERKQIKANPFSIKETDYIYITNEEYGISLTMLDFSYASVYTLTYIDHKFKKSHSKSFSNYLTFGRTGLTPSTKIGNFQIEGPSYSIQILNNGNERRLICNIKNFTKYSDFKCDIIYYENNDKSIVSTVPFEKVNEFLYDQKIVDLTANGNFSIGESKYDFINATAYQNYLRAVIPSETSYISSVCTFKEDRKVIKSITLSNGLIKTNVVTQNYMVTRKEATPLSNVTYLIPKDEQGNYKFDQPIHIVTDDNELKLLFIPLHYGKIKIPLFGGTIINVFGSYQGSISTNKDKPIKIKNAFGLLTKYDFKY